MSEGWDAGGGQIEPPRAVGPGEVLSTGEVPAAGPAGPDFVEEMPTVPPASRGGNVGLRWATPGPRPVGGREPNRRPPLPGHARPGSGVLAHWPSPSSPGTPAPVEPETGPPRRSPPRAPKRAKLIVTGLAALLVVLAGTALAVELSRGPGPFSASGPEVAFDGLLAKSAGAHRLARGAIGNPCRTAAPDAAVRAALQAQLSRADGMLKSVLAGLATDNTVLSRVPHATLLITDLGRVTRASVAVDADYGAWLQDLQATGCYSAPTNDIHYRAAARASRAEAAPARQLAAAWAPIAVRYRLRAWTPSEL